MADAFDVALRVKLDYQGSAAARTATGDLGAIEATARRLGTSSTVLAVARDLGELRKVAEVARLGLNDLASAGARLNRSAGGRSGVAADIGRVATEAATAGRAVDALGDKLGAAIRAQRAAGGFKSGADFEAFLKSFDAQVKGAEKQTAALGKVAAGAREAHREVSEVGEAAAAAARDIEKMGAAEERARGRSPRAEDPVRRAGQTWRRRERSESLEQRGAEVAEAGYFAEQRRRMRLMDRSAAVEARRQRQEERDAERQSRAEAREAERAARVTGAAGGGHGGRGGAGQGGAGHSGPSGLYGAAVAAARPLRMERLLMSATTPTGLLGLGAGLGVAGVAHQMEDAARRAIELEDALNDVRRSTGTMSAEGVKSLEGEILRTSRATGTASGELARMAATAAAAGRPAEDLPRFMDLGAKAAGAFGGKVDEVGSRLTRIGSDFGLDQDGLQRVTDTAALLQERTGARGAGTLDFMAETGGTAKLAGFAPDRLAAYGATMGKLGMAPGEAASTFSGLLEKLETAPQQGGGFKEGLTRIMGPGGAPESPYALRNAVRADPSSGMMRFLEDVKRLPDGRRQMVLTQMFGAEDGDRIARMADHLEDFKKNLTTVQDTAARNGAVERVFSVFDEATSKKIDRASEAIGVFATKVGQHFAPAMGAAADATARFFGGWLDKMDRLEKAGEIADKIARGVAISPEDQKKLDADPALKAATTSQVAAIGVARANDAAASPDPGSGRAREMTRMGAPAAAPVDAEAARERDRLALVDAIRENTVYAREHGGVGADEAANLRAAYEAQYPDKPLPAFSRGGPVSGPGGPREDRVLARVSPGEFVINARSTAKHFSTVKAINDDTLPAYADGGAVGAVTPARNDPSAMSRLEDTIAKGVKTGVVAGLREARDMPGSAATGQAVRASEAAGGGGEIGGEGGSGHANLRYGRGGGGAPNLRYGSVGGRARGTPAGRARGGYRDTPGSGYGGAVPGANGYGTIDAPYRAPIDAKGEGGQLSPRELFGYLKAHGATDNEATMLTGAAGNESSFNPRAVHDGGHGHGLWGHNDGRIDMRGKTWQEQADLALGEVKKQYAGRVNAAKTPEELADAEMHYERPRGYHSNNPRGGDNYTGRANTLRRFGNEFGTMKSGPPSPAVASAEKPMPGDGKMPDWMNDRSKRELSAVNGDLARDLLAASKETGIHFNVAQGLRDQAEADRNAASGRGVRNSQHLYGAAADLHMLDGQGRETYDRAAYKTFGDAFERIQRSHGQHGRWLGNLPGRWGRDIVHFDQGIGYGQTHARNPYGSARPTHDDVVAGNTDAYRSPMNPFTHGAQPTLSPRFTDPGLRRVYEGGAKVADAGGGGTTSGTNAGHAPTVVQHFHGQHDPRETAMHARRESNREIKRAQARALHGVGRPA